MIKISTNCINALEMQFVLRLIAIFWSLIKTRKCDDHNPDLTQMRKCDYFICRMYLIMRKLDCSLFILRDKSKVI